MLWRMVPFLNDVDILIRSPGGLRPYGCGLVGASRRPEWNSQPIPPVDGDDREREIDNLLLAKMRAKLLITRIVNLVRSDPRYRLCPVQGGTLPIGKEWRFPPGRERIKALFGFTGFPRVFGVHVQAIGTAIELGSARLHQFHEAAIQIASINVDLQRSKRSDSFWRSFPIIQSCFHWVPFRVTPYQLQPGGGVDGFQPGGQGSRTAYSPRNPVVVRLHLSKAS